MKNYSYPRVITSVTTLPRSSGRPEPEDTTVLFTPIISTTGPEREIVKIHSLEEYRSVFGIDERLGLTLLNISNWLTAGGTLYAYRLVKLTSDGSDKVKTDESAVKRSIAKAITTVTTDQSENYEKPIFIAESKYYGSALNGYKISALLDNGGKSVIIKLSNDGITRERFSVSLNLKDAKKYSYDDQENSNRYVYEISVDVSSKSEYLSKLKFYFGYTTEDNEDTIILTKFSDDESTSISESFENGTDGFTSYESALAEFWSGLNNNKSDLEAAIGNPLTTPIDLIMDAGYSKEIKRAMVKTISHLDNIGEVDALRPDIRGYFDIGSCSNEDISTISEDNVKNVLFADAGSTKPYKETKNIFVYNQSCTISEEAYFDKDMTVYPSYFLSSLIPTIDSTYGIQYPVAGKRRAELSGIKKISENPLPDDKETWFQARVNYIEKDSRGYYFMSQRTFDGSTEDDYDALSFINNSRVTCKMVHDLESIGRDYLYEFNDATTLANMSSVMNRYVTNWISNRTLSFGNVVVTADKYSEEKVNAVLNIKFTGTIEVISIDLILQ